MSSMNLYDKYFLSFECSKMTLSTNAFSFKRATTSHYKLGTPKLASCVAMARTETRNFLMLSLLILLLRYASDKVMMSYDERIQLKGAFTHIASPKKNEASTGTEPESFSTSSLL